MTSSDASLLFSSALNAGKKRRILIYESLKLFVFDIVRVYLHISMINENIQTAEHAEDAEKKYDSL